MIKINSLSKEYIMGDNKLLALDDVSVSINAGEFVSIMGSSGEPPYISWQMFSEMVSYH